MAWFAPSGGWKALSNIGICYRLILRNEARVVAEMSGTANYLPKVGTVGHQEMHVPFTNIFHGNHVVHLWLDIATNFALDIKTDLSLLNIGKNVMMDYLKSALRESLADLKTPFSDFVINFGRKKVITCID